MKKKRREFGKHYLVEFTGCDPETIKYTGSVEKIFLKAARKSKARIVEYYFHQYRPFGVTGIILIKWSHFSLHSWPEDNYVAFDVFTCGEMKPEVAIEVIKQGFRARAVKTRVISRGY
ncbi:MAG: adenosylmethionine decarboxylase [Candidatus Omnitrophica bacterium]|nr:adenosylmethionine decarboxylase [Candidatus Omnitrophota bacterium]